MSPRVVEGMGEPGVGHHPELLVLILLEVVLPQHHQEPRDGELAVGGRHHRPGVRDQLLEALSSGNIQLNTNDIFLHN